MLDEMIKRFLEFFQDPSAWGIGLAIGFGVVWLAPYRPPLFKRPWLWAVLVTSAFLTLAAVCFVQIPLQSWTGQELVHLSILVAGIPLVLLSGLVQEGAKLVPVVVYWGRSGKNIDPKLGLAIGAVAGAGFAIFEAQWVHNQIFSWGWTWAAVQTGGFMALLGFWERFFSVAAHIGFSALAGYGLAKGWGWQYYLIASGLHALLNYGAALWQAGLLTDLHVEIYVAVMAALVTAWALWLRWRKTTAEPGPETVAVAEAGTGTGTAVPTP